MANVYPRVGPIVISEIMYHPPDVGTNDNTRDEFIELQNISTVPVPLFDGTNGWHLRDAVDFDFAPGTVIRPGEFLLVVGFDPVNNPTALAGFRSRYNVATGTAIVGPYSGKLGNDGDDIELRKPGVPDLSGVDYILVEQVRYFDAAPWPASADGIGLSLQRSTATEFGNDAGNWFADSPTPGPAASTGDADNDGMADSWESQFGFDPLNPLDAGLDSDGDGLTNLQEFQLGTNPRNPASGLRLNIARPSRGAGVVLSFAAAANVAYAIDYTGTPGTGWQPLRSFAAVSTNRVEQLSVASGEAKQFYRLRTETGVVPVALRINSVQLMPGGQVKLTFTVAPNQASALEQRGSLTSGSWSTVTNVPMAATARLIEVTVPRSANSSFFRLRSP